MLDLCHMRMGPQLSWREGIQYDSRKQSLN